MKTAPNHRFALGALTLSLAALVAACTSKSTPPGAESGKLTPPAEGLKPLQGHWEGDGAGGKCSITIEGDSLYYRNARGWFKTTFMLPAGTEPRQLHATIKECSPPSDSSIGTVVHAIYKIEDGTLTLADFDPAGEPPKSFEGAPNRYVVKKVEPKEKV
jgi:uncharacterized protein (TIGR03067 family)